MKSYALAILICFVWAINAAPGIRDARDADIEILYANFNESYELEITYLNDTHEYEDVVEDPRFIGQRLSNGHGQQDIDWSVDGSTHRLREGEECNCGRMAHCSALSCIDGLTCQKTNDYDERHHQMMSKCLRPPMITEIPRL